MKKTILITGCSSGFGRATARHFAREGWNVIATMRQPERETEFYGFANVFVIRLDVQDRTSVAAAIDAGIARFGRIDALVNNAGFGLFGLFEATPREKVAEQFDVNVFGVMEVTRAILPHFRQNQGGVILNVGSGAGVFTLPMLSLYCASKFALEGFSEALAYELASQGIVVKMIEPGGVLSTNFGRRGVAEAAQNAALSGYAAFVAQTETVFAGLRATRLATEEDVAKVIFDAATDGTDRLRYVATEDIKPLVRARRETSEDEYIATMRRRFMPPGVKRALPPPVAALVAAMNRHDADAVAGCFAQDAVVHDEGKIHHGRTAIKAWYEDVSQRYRATLAVAQVATEGDEVILTGEVSGNFDGSPIELRYRLTVRNETIMAFSVAS